MSGTQPMDESALISEGLSSYWNARFAMRAFESAVQEAARLALKAKLTELGEACTVGKALQENQIWPHSPEPDCRLGQVAIGAGCPWESYGIRLGIGWRSSGEEGSQQPVACLTIRASAQWKRDKISSALKPDSSIMSKTNTDVDASGEWPYEVAVWSRLDPGADIERVKTALSAVLDNAIEWSKAAGSLRKIVYGDTQPEAITPEQEREVT